MYRKDSDCLMALRKEIAPKGMTFNANDFFISDKFATILTVVSSSYI